MSKDEAIEVMATVVEPLPNKQWVRDLVTEIAPPDERLNPGSDSS